MYCTGGIRCDVYSTILRLFSFPENFSLFMGISLTFVIRFTLVENILIFLTDFPKFSHARQKGFQNLYTLSGGVSNYLKNEGSAEWVGNLFVFDGRLSLPPSTYKPGANTNAAARPNMVHKNNTFARCYICGSEFLEFRHRNCANIDCNRLFL